jgi:hypothetical protein
MDITLNILKIKHFNRTIKLLLWNVKLKNKRKMKKPINSVRVIIPANPKDLLELGQKVYDKHLDAAAQSPLTSLSWNVQGPLIADALSFHVEAEELRKQMEILYEKRNLILNPVDDLVKQSRDLLKAIYRNEPHKIGEFGFEVNNTPPPAKKDDQV